MHTNIHCCEGKCKHYHKLLMVFNTYNLIGNIEKKLYIMYMLCTGCILCTCYVQGNSSKCHLHIFPKLKLEYYRFVPDLFERKVLEDIFNSNE